MKKYFIKTYGCQMNESDSERIAGWYEEKGWKRAKSIEEADEMVIVSCSVRESAENRVFGLINNLSRHKTQNLKLKTKFKISKLSGQKIILTGCMLRYPLKWLREKLPEVDEFRKNQEFRGNSQSVIRNSKIHAWVPIMEGCSHFCTYCVVPYARGQEKSRTPEEIVCEVKELARRGYKEITLLGQNVNSYQPSFARLIRRLHEIPGIKKISFITSNPWDLTNEIIEAMSLPKIDRYLHLPVQSGDDGILKKMNRKYTASQYLKVVKKIRKKILDIQIGTDIIVGFPGETEAQFQNTVELCKKVGFAKAYVAMYSPRLQTAAYKLKDDIPHKKKKRRWEILENLINK